MSVTVESEVVKQSWIQRLGSSFKGVLTGLVVFVIGFPVLFWNEGRTVRQAKALSEGRGACVEVESNSAVNSANEDKLVHMTGKADTHDMLVDAQFGVRLTGIKLNRKVEMYQWEEESHTTTEKRGDKEVKKTTYTCKQVWSDHVIDSTQFHDDPAQHANPSAMEFSSEKQQAKQVSFGAFQLTEAQINRMGKAQAYVLPSNYVCAIARAQVMNNVIYVPNAETRNNPLNNRKVAEMPRVGDLRVTYTCVMPHEISIVAKQSGASFGIYKAKNGNTVDLYADEVKTADEMFASAESANSTMAWILRFVGFLLMFVGMKMVLGPIATLVDVIPVVRSVVSAGVSFIAFIIAAACALVTIGIAWVFYRPLLGGALIAVAVGLLIFAKTRKASKPQTEIAA